MADMQPENNRFIQPTPEDTAYYVQLEANMTRAGRIRGRMLPLVGLVTSLLICVLTPTWYGIFVGSIPPSACLVLGVLLSLVTVPFHLLGSSRKMIRIGWVKSLFYAVGILLNTAGTSLCMAAYYVHLGDSPSSAEGAAVLAVVTLLYGLTALFIQILHARYGLVTAVASLLTVAGGIVSVVFWIRNNEKTLWSLGFFLFLWALINLIALHVACSDVESPWLRFSSFAAFGLLMIVAVVVLIILACAAGDCDCDCSDGDCCDCGDCGCGDTASEKAAAKRRRKK